MQLVCIVKGRIVILGLDRGERGEKSDEAVGEVEGVHEITGGKLAHASTREGRGHWGPIPHPSSPPPAKWSLLR